MLAFITGATGFVGSHVARVLAEKGADLRLLVRSSSNLKNIEGLNAERIVGDLRDPESLEKAMSGCDAVFTLLRITGCGCVIQSRCTKPMLKARVGC